MKTLQIQVPDNKETVVKVILKELGISFKAIKEKPLTQDEKHIVSALKQADLADEGKLQTADAQKFLDELGWTVEIFDKSDKENISATRLKN